MFAFLVARAKADDDASEAKFWQVSAEDTGTQVTFTLRYKEEVVTFTVERYHPAGTFPEVIAYRVVGEDPLAGDHGEILARAWDEKKK